MHLLSQPCGLGFCWERYRVKPQQPLFSLQWSNNKSPFPFEGIQKANHRLANQVLQFAKSFCLYHFIDPEGQISCLVLCQFPAAFLLSCCTEGRERAVRVHQEGVLLWFNKLREAPFNSTCFTCNSLESSAILSLLADCIPRSVSKSML